MPRGPRSACHSTTCSGKPTGKGNLFVVFGEPDIEIVHEADGRLMVHVKGVDVFDPTTGEVRSDGPDGIACWFVDTDCNEESFFVRHAYVLGQNDPYGLAVFHGRRNPRLMAAVLRDRE